MNGLKQVTLIKSAKFDFASVSVDGNSLFIGANGAGKTTLLRAILYFYTASSTGLGISNNKKISFSDYYFEYENSYIAYVYKKDDKYVLVTAYKDGAVKFRFTLFNTMPNIKEIYTKNDEPLLPAELFIKLKELGTCSNIIQNGAKYKEILYSKNHKLKYFSLFEAKDYESFTKTLSNIFINSKVDSDAIKKVIVSSLGIDNKIDISQIQRYLSRFNGYYEDIKYYEQNSSIIKEVINTLDQYEQTKGLLQDDMSTLCNSKQKCVELLDTLNKEIEKLQNEHSVLIEKKGYEQSLYHKRKDKLNQSKGGVDSFLKQVNNKKDKYKKENIEQKLEAYDTLHIEREKLKSVNAKKDFLTKESEDIKTNHTLQIQTIENSFITSKNIFQSKIYDLKKEQDKKISLIEKEQSIELEKINEEYHKKSLEQKDQQKDQGSQIQELNYKIKDLQNKTFVFEDEVKYQEHLKQQDDTKVEINKAQQQIQTLDIQLENKKEIYAQHQKSIEEKQNQSIENINKQIYSVKSLISPKQNSLLNKIDKHDKQRDKYIYFLKDEILQSDMEGVFKESSDAIFEFEPENLDIPQSGLESDLKKLKTLLSKAEKSFSKQIDTLNKEFKNFENKRYKDKRQLNETIKTLQITQTTHSTKISKLLEDKKIAQKLFDEEKQKKLKVYKSSKIEHNQQLQILENISDDQNKEKENDIKNKKSYLTKSLKKIDLEFKVPLEKLNLEINNLEVQKKENIKNQENLYHTLLKDKNVNITHLKSLEKEQLKLEETIKTIESYQTVIIEYKKDKIEYFDMIQSKNKELKSIKESIKSLENNFEDILKKLDEKQKNLQQTLNQKENVFNEQNYSHKRAQEFEKTSTFVECIDWGIKYIKNDDIDDIATLIGRIDNTASKYRGFYAKVQRLLQKLNGIFDNTLNITKDLDALDTAYRLKEYHQSNKIEKAKDLLGQNLSQIINSIISQYDKLLESQGKIETLIKKITKIFQEIKIGVIDTLALRYSKTNNKIIELFSAIKEENQHNSFSFEQNSLFGEQNDSKKIIELFKKLIDLIEFENNETIDIEDSFILEFRVVENGNDSRYVQSLDMIGSNGTDVLVKSMIYVAMLHIFKEKITKKELSFQVVLDEVGILSQRYLKELIEFANKKAIVFVNGAPDEKLIGTYKQVSLISKIDKISVVKELILK
ncbi:MAG: ATP-binding protein [Campylobacterota bacterium]|nr:ATP-binding protein [Campylobacterota bacterium]